MARKLYDLGLLTEIDRTALALYCQAWARWVEAEEEVRKLGAIVKSPSGYPIQNPYLAVANRAMRDLRAMLTEFGMTPSSRSRVSVEQAEEGDDFFGF
jgi:P27 family predicted phage terminase small subunit